MNEKPETHQYEKRQYVYRVSGSKYDITVEVGIYQADRWAGQRQNQPGGFKFGFTAEASVYGTSFGDDLAPRQATVSMGSIGSHSPEDADERIDVYRQATDIARFINDQTAQDESLENITAWLTSALNPGQPTDAPFRYGTSKQVV